MQVLETIAAAHPDIEAEAYSAILLCALCLARGDTVAGVMRALGMSEQDGLDISKAEILAVAQLTWRAVHPKMDSAAKVHGFLCPSAQEVCCPRCFAVLHLCWLLLCFDM